MCNEVVHDGGPVFDTFQVHLKESWVQQEFQGLSTPRLAGVLVTADGCHKLGGGTQAGQVIRAVGQYGTLQGNRSSAQAGQVIQAVRTIWNIT
ncbi:hypothetical protein DPMN_043669 [Dreissena polymorpha]|uniref:Uncharacterized protein n=1 Tax=Dreissena polymorpha TaxID=45954 RepID=A0A9D4HY55_DREPO|nr:hypothetical protein DPMN_043669 [Dreissena polymorpha]